MNTSSQKIIALLGPTNTGKTHVAIEKMLELTKRYYVKQKAKQIQKELEAFTNRLVHYT